MVKKDPNSINSGLNSMWRSVRRGSLESAKVFVVAITLVSITLGIFGWLLSFHWLPGFLLIAVYGYVILETIRSFRTQRPNITQGIALMVFLVCLSAAVFATVSFMIMSIKAGSYVGPSKITFFHLLLYYAWLFLDLLPAIDAVKTLGIVPPIEHRGKVAALPIVAFKGFVILVLLKVIKDWWNEVHQTNNSSRTDGSAQQIVGPERR